MEFWPVEGFCWSVVIESFELPSIFCLQNWRSEEKKGKEEGKEGNFLRRKFFSFFAIFFIKKLKNFLIKKYNRVLFIIFQLRSKIFVVCIQLWAEKVDNKLSISISLLFLRYWSMVYIHGSIQANLIPPMKRIKRNLQLRFNNTQENRAEGILLIPREKAK